MVSSGERLAARTVRAFSWRLAGRLASLVVKLGVMIVLARLLPVRAFGVVGQIATISVLARALSDIGMMPAVIQRRDLTETHVRVAFTVCLVMGSLLTACVWITATFAAAVYRTPELAPVLRFVSVTFCFESLSLVAQALTRRDLNFRTLSLIDIACYAAAYGAIGIGLAVAGAGVWAIAWATVAEAALRTTVLLLVAPHSARPCFAAREARELLSFGGAATFSLIAGSVAAYGGYAVVGRFLGPYALGLYSRAYQLMTMPTNEFSNAVSTVLLPSYAAVQDDPARLRRAYVAAVSMSILVSAPLLTCVAITAPGLITLVLGTKWVGVVVPLQIMCAGGVLRSTFGLGEALARATGDIARYAWCNVAYAVAVFAGSFAGLPWGIRGVAVGVLGAMAVMYALSAWFCNRLTDTPWTAFLAAHVPGMVVAASGACVAMPVAILLRASEHPDALALGCTLAAFAAGAIGTLRVLPRRFVGEEVLSAVESTRIGSRVLALTAMGRRRADAPT